MQQRDAIDTNQTVNQALESVIEAYPDQVALVIGGTRLTYRQFGDQIDALAAGLDRAGIRQGENVAIILPNCLEGFTAFFAVCKLGAVAVPLNMRLGPHDLRYLLAEVDAVAVITVAEVMGRPYLPLIQALRPGLPKVRQLIVKGGEGGDGVVPLEDLLVPVEPGAVPQITINPDDVCSIFCSSGTTGLPKGAMHTHKSALSISDAMLQSRCREDVEIMLAPFPLFHIGGLVILLPFFVGGKLVVLEVFDPVGVLKAIEAEKVVALGVVPLFFHAILRVPDLDQYDLSSLRFVGGGSAPFGPDLIRAIQARFGSGTWWQGYGLTEAMWVSASTADDPEEAQLYTVGRPSLVQAEVIIVDDERREVPIGSVGEVACRTTGMMKGYYKRPEATREVLDEEGWLYTGDLGTLDEGGYLRLVGRKKDMIKRGAEAIFPAEIEQFLMTHPKIQAAAVIGVPIAMGDERVWAYVQPRAGAELGETEVVDYCRDQIATHKIPEQVRIVDSLPLTATQKVQKFKLREQAQAELAG